MDTLAAIAALMYASSASESGWRHRSFWMVRRARNGPADRGLVYTSATAMLRHVTKEDGDER